MPPFGATLPGAQLAGSEEPVAQDEPGGHGRHHASLSSLLSLPKRPRRHGRGSAAPVSQKYPGWHSAEQF